MKPHDITYNTYIEILKEELVPAMGCTEPIAIAYCAAKARDVLGCMPDSVTLYVSGNIVKNVKSVIVPNTNGLKGIEAAAAAGIVGGKAEKILEVIADVTAEQKDQMRTFLEECPIVVRPAESDEALDIHIMLTGGGHTASVRISGYHTNIVLMEKDDTVLFKAGEVKASKEASLADKSLLTIKDIVEFANIVDIEDIREILDRQIAYNTAIAEEGLKNNWGANVGSVLLKQHGDNLRTRAKAYAAAGSDARMSGCELPVIINSGSGNQGMTASLPVIVYAEGLGKTREELYRALALSNLVTIHQKTGIGRLSAYCGAISAGCGAGCGIAYLQGGDCRAISHTLVNALAIVSGIVCDGAKASCAGKIASAVDAGIFGYEMYLEQQQFYGGDGLVSKGVENTLVNIGRLGSVGMKETDKEIIRIMTGC
ncbi:MAG: serine dehydratase subunit alpha family protein [Lachnospiraceae bacterium]|nr:serine dehydratase subunit alpha family protein [Lachnospiraceae bacterium]